MKTSNERINEDSEEEEDEDDNDEIMKTDSSGIKINPSTEIIIMFRKYKQRKIVKWTLIEYFYCRSSEERTRREKWIN